MNVIRHAATLTAGLAVAAAAPTLSAQVNRVAVVDLQRAVAEVEDGRRALKRLKRWVDRHEGELNEEQERLKVLEASFHEMEDGPPKRARAEELQKAIVELRARYVDLQQEAAERQAKATRPIITRMQQIVRNIARTEGYQLVVERGQAGVLWVPSNQDLTDLVIQRYNLGEGREGEPPPRRRRRRRRTKRQGAGADPG